MIRWRALCLTFGALTALPLLSGCVAAAIPALAATGVIGTQLEGKDREAATRGQPRVAIDLAQPAPGSPEVPAPAAYARSYTLADGTRMEVMAGAADFPSVAAGAAEPTPASVSPSQAVPAADFMLSDGTRARVVSGPLPAPVAARAAGYEAFASFAAREGTLPAAGSERRSAMLADPGTLAPATRECSVHPAAVLVDLDPAAGKFDPGAAVEAAPGLAPVLAGLRAEGIAIGWLSANTADRAGALRRALVASGLDPAGRDTLALLRYPDERKQTRREDFAKEFCVVAIAGDDRADFDELFQFLKDPLLATPLEPLIGNGWFLIPQPLS